MPLAARMRRMAFTMVVLPTPGPPVMTGTHDRRAMRVAAVCVAASAKPIFRSIHGRTFSESMSVHGKDWSANRRKRSAMTCSARSPRVPVAHPTRR